MTEASGCLKKMGGKVNPSPMVRFVCARCNRQLVWADASVTVKCPSCGRWIRANRFWQEAEPKRKVKLAKVTPEQLELF